MQENEAPPAVEAVDNAEAVEQVPAEAVDSVDADATQNAETAEQAEAVERTEVTEQAVTPENLAAVEADAVQNAETAEQAEAAEAVEVFELVPEAEAVHGATTDMVRLRAIVEAIVYLTDEPLSVEQLAGALRQDRDVVAQILGDLTAEYEKPEHGVAIREVAGGFAMATKPEHHEEVRAFVKNMQAPMKLSLPSLETLAVIAYRQPITAPEVMEIRGVQGAGVLKTLLDRKLIAAAGRKNVVGKPILYKTTKEFLVQFGLKDLAELPSLKEFEEIRRMSIADEPEPMPQPVEVAPESAEGTSTDGN